MYGHNKKTKKKKAWDVKEPKILEDSDPKSRVDLKVDDFDRLIEQKGVNVRVYRTAYCPNVKSVDAGEHEIDCDLCNGSAYIDRNPLCVKAFIQNQELERMLDQMGAHDGNSVLMTFPIGIELQYFTLIELVDFTEIYYQRVLRKEDSGTDVLKYKACRVNMIVDSSGVEYFQDQDFKLDANGSVKWLTSTTGSPTPIVWDHLLGSITAIGSSLTKGAGPDDWDTAAYTNTTVNGSQANTMTAKMANLVGAFGLATSAPSQSGAYQQMFVIGHFNPGDGSEVGVCDDGNVIFAIGTSTPTDELSIKIDSAGVVKAYKNDVEFYTFSQSATGRTLIPFGSCWNPGNVITSATILDAAQQVTVYNRAPAANVIYTIHYEKHVQFRATRAMHVNRFTQYKAPGEPKVEHIKMMEQWLCTKEFLLRRKDINTGNDLEQGPYDNHTNTTGDNS